LSLLDEPAVVWKNRYSFARVIEGADQDSVEVVVAVVERVIVEQVCTPLVSSRALAPFALTEAQTRNRIAPTAPAVEARIPKLTVQVPAGKFPA
jgi:hypothetical protein